MKIVNAGNYNIIIKKNILEQAEEYIESVLPREKHRKCFIITDNNIEKYNYSDVLIKSLTKYKCEKIIIKSGESSKSFSNYQKIAEIILNKGLTRSDFLIALGGGVVGDLTGFLAATLLRGVPFIQIPTTLLSQVDSSVGGKTAINTKFGKNLIGVFYEPAMVLIDLNVLNTLNDRNLKSGYAEIFKLGLIGDTNFFEYCEEYGKELLKRNTKVTEYMVEKSCQFKANIVKQDPFEKKDLRVLLNLGHTFGHIYEKLVNFNQNKILHGEAVALGIKNAFIVSKKLKIMDSKEVDRVLKHMEELELFNFSNLKKLREYKEKESFNEYLFDNMKKDKKFEFNSYNLVLNDRIGHSIFIRNVDLKSINDFFN